MKLYFSICGIYSIWILLNVTSNCVDTSFTDIVAEKEQSNSTNATTDPLKPIDSGGTEVPFVYQEGYVFDEAIGNDCVKWGFYLPPEKEETPAEFRKRMGVPVTGKNLHENCDVSRKPSECKYPLECVNTKCQCLHLWNSLLKRCQIPPMWVPPNNGPGCFSHEECVEKANCFWQFQCHCTGDSKCEIVYGICKCEHPFPPHGFQAGHCERQSDDDYTRHIEDLVVIK